MLINFHWPLLWDQLRGTSLRTGMYKIWQWMGFGETRGKMGIERMGLSSVSLSSCWHIGEQMKYSVVVWPWSMVSIMGNALAAQSWFPVSGVACWSIFIGLCKCTQQCFCAGVEVSLSWGLHSHNWTPWPSCWTLWSRCWTLWPHYRTPWSWLWELEVTFLPRAREVTGAPLWLQLWMPWLCMCCSILLGLGRTSKCNDPRVPLSWMMTIQTSHFNQLSDIVKDEAQ